MTNAKTRRMEKAQRIRLARSKARADAYFIIYYDIGPERSLEKLCDHLTELGLKRSLATLKSYSSKYDWQQRLITEDTRRHDQDLADADKRRFDMMEKHSKIGRTLQTLSLAGMLSFQDTMKKKEGRLPFSPTEVVALAKTGIDLELRAAGEPTLKVEITTVLYNVLVARMAVIFKDINQLPTTEARESQYAQRCDQMAVSAIEEVNMLVEGKG